MANPHLKREVFYTRLISVAPYKKRYYFFFQNFQPSPFDFNGEQYEYLPFNIANYSSNIDLDGSSGVLQVPNIDMVRDVILSDIKGIENTDDIKDKDLMLLGGRIKIDTYFPEDTSAPFLSYTYIINSIEFNDQFITFNLRSPLTSFNGMIPSSKFDQSRFKELPFSASNNYTSGIRPF